MTHLLERHSNNILFHFEIYSKFRNGYFNHFICIRYVVARLVVTKTRCE